MIFEAGVKQALGGDGLKRDRRDEAVREQVVPVGAGPRYRKVSRSCTESTGSAEDRLSRRGEQKERREEERREEMTGPDAAR